MIFFQSLEMAKPKRSVAAKVLERARACQCLICDAEAEELGLCLRHVRQFRGEMAKLPLDQREQFRAEMVRDGKVLAPHEARKLREENPFSRDLWH